jgi:4-carboxymuconolactone decarboxylase
MMTEPPEAPSLLEIAAREQLFGTVWNRPGLSVRERRFVTLVCLAWAVDLAAMDAHIYAALASGDLTVEQMNEFTLHFAVYCGWPKASHVEVAVRTQWQRLQEERGEPGSWSFPPLPLEDLGAADPAARIAGGVQSFEEINLVPAPSQDSPYFFAGILNFVFGHLWLRPGLTRRERRLITIPCVGVEQAPNPIWSHVTSALGSGDISYVEMQELILHFAAYTDGERAGALETIATQWKDTPA